MSDVRWFEGAFVDRQERSWEAASAGTRRARKVALDLKWKDLISCRFCLDGYMRPHLVKVGYSTGLSSHTLCSSLAVHAR